jgi:hypothetical protein
MEAIGWRSSEKGWQVAQCRRHIRTFLCKARQAAEVNLARSRMSSQPNGVGTQRATKSILKSERY